MSLTGIIFDIKKYALHDGPGIRTTIFFKGCPLSCLWCHNPESQNMKPELIRRQSLIKKNEYKNELVGKEVSIKEVIAEIEKDSLFYDQSGGGVTFSGGEPLFQHEFLKEVVDYCYENEIHMALDTCGYAPWNHLESIKDKIDLFLYDLKIIEDKKHQKFTGVSNEKILTNLKKLDQEHKNIIIRFPVIPSITDTTKNLNELNAFLTTLISVKEINLLPYHKIGVGKYQQLQLVNPLENLEPPSSEQLSQITQIFVNIGYTVKIGG